ncbi:MAG: hypothetical protein AAF802_18540, partial [Planctomycetota bacterium]
MSRCVSLMIASLVTCVLCIVALVRHEIAIRENGRLLVYCAASNRAVMDEIRTSYEKDFGRKVD